jgi:hypothetical protein
MRLTHTPCPSRHGNGFVAGRGQLLGQYHASWRSPHLQAQQRLDRATLVHRAVAFRHLIKRQRQIENLAGIDLAVPHEIDQLRQKAADWGGA